MPPVDESSSDLAGDLMRVLRRSVEAASEAASSSRHAFGLAVDFVALRRQLAVVRDVFQSHASAERDAIMTAVWSIYRERPEVLNSDSRADVVRSWTHLLIDATEKVEHDEIWAERYARGQAPDEDALVGAAASTSSAALRDL